jgi:hypothetical protein
VLEWLGVNHIQLNQLTLADMDRWLLTGSPTLRQEVADFRLDRRSLPYPTADAGPPRQSCQTGRE